MSLPILYVLWLEERPNFCTGYLSLLYFWVYFWFGVFLIADIFSVTLIEEYDEFVPRTTRPKDNTSLKSKDLRNKNWEFSITKRIFVSIRRSELILFYTITSLNIYLILISFDNKKCQMSFITYLFQNVISYLPSARPNWMLYLYFVRILTYRPERKKICQGFPHLCPNGHFFIIVTCSS